MGLNTTHGCWDGSYSAFMRWRLEIARAAGVPLLLMEGFCEVDRAKAYLSDPSVKPYVKSFLEREIIDSLPLKWEMLQPDIIHVLLHHSDYDGEIVSNVCAPLADRLEKLLPLLPDGDGGGHIGNWREKTQTFIDGLRLAADLGEDVEFR